MQSIRNNKHNHLTATYYLLLKKRMVRHLKDYVDAFMELDPYVEPKTLMSEPIKVPETMINLAEETPSDYVETGGQNFMKTQNLSGVIGSFNSKA